MFDTAFWVFLLWKKEIPLLLLGEQKPLLVQMDSIKHVMILGQIHRIPEVQCHQQPCHFILFCQNRLECVTMNMNGQTNNPTMHSCLRYPHRYCKFSLGMPLPQQDILDTLLDELCWIYSMSPEIFFQELVSREIISPMAHMHATHSHSQYTVLCATLNLLVMMVINPLHRPSLHCMLWSIKIICNHKYFNISLFLGHGGGAPSSEASPSSISAMPKYDLFTKPIFLLEKMTIKHFNIYIYIP